MAIALDRTATGSALAAASTVLTWSGGVTPGALMVAGIAASADGITYTWPAGWVRVGAFDPTDTVGSLEARAKIAGAAEPGTVTVSHAATNTAGVATTWTGADAIRSLGALARETAASLTHDAGSFVTPDAAERLLVAFAALVDVAGPIAPAGFSATTDINIPGVIVAQLAFKIVSAAGTTPAVFSGPAVGKDWASLGMPFGPGTPLIAGDPGGGLL